MLNNTKRIPRRTLTRAAVLATALAAAAWFSLPRYAGDLEDFRAGAKILDSRGSVMRRILGEEDTLCEPVPLAETGHWTAKALIAAEDKRFFRHRGVDFIALCRAAAQNVVCRRVVSGASTLTTLVVKLTQPRRRTLWTKAVEARHALALEKKLSKEKILEQYLNRAPFGANIHGIEAASRRYFGKSAQELSLAESALLVGLPQSPSRLRPDRYYARALERQAYVLERMKACRYISDEQFRSATDQLMTIRQEALPFDAPHFCESVLERYSVRAEVRTTLDLEFQAIAEDVLRSRLSQLSRFGIHGGAVVIIDVRTATLLAMVGSPDFWNTDASGQVNAATARRSPGSTLKPFAYAAAIDQGMLTPARITADVPSRFSGYNPRNFNLEYCGPVTVRCALVRSLNIPALRCAQRVGLRDFVQSLRNMGFSTLDQPAARYGLSIVVGTCEVTLLELANAYACLARNGIYSPLRFLQDEPAGREKQLYSVEAAYMIADILGGDERAFDLTGHVADVVLPRVAWKTGTSTGLRDAWTVAYNPEYVVGVWIGNPDGAPSSKLVGSVAAAPVAGEVFRRIYPDGDSPWYERPAALKRRKVCARSGMAPNPWCPTTVMDDYIPGISSPRRCDVHRRVRGTERESDEWQVTEHWPPEIEAFLRTRGMQEPSREHARDGESEPLRITSPSGSDTFHLVEQTAGGEQKVKLAAISGAGASAMYWFVDGELLCRAGPDQPVFWGLRRGHHTINCTDDSGNCDSVAVVVK